MITPDEFLKIVRNDKKEKVVKFAEVADSEGRLIFDGETVATVKKYPSLSSYSPSVGDRVMIFQGVIVGKIGDYEGGGGGQEYIHPSTHPASMITESATRRFVSDTEKTLWNSKSDGNHNHTLASLTEKSYNSLTNRPTLGTAASKNTGTGSGTIPILDSNGKLDNSIIPALAGGVISINGKSGNVTLTSSDIEAFSGISIMDILEGHTDALDLRARTYTTTIGNGTATEFTIDHNLGSDVIVSLEEVATGEIVYADIQKMGMFQIKIMFGLAPSVNQYRVTAIGTVREDELQ